MFLLHKADQAVLAHYLVPYYEAARKELGKKYGYVPDEPVRVEVFHTWDDFSVRTTGFRGFTALGACFGPMITLVSPDDSDLRRNDFMWTATVWHEYTHVLTLALSDHRVPRWLTEGFSVYEEGARDKSWERGMTRDLFDAYFNGEIIPVRLLNRVFRGPRILFGYYEGGLIVDLLAQEHGFDKVVDMLRAYAKDLSTEAVFQQTFGFGTRDFDQQFLKWIKEKKLAGLRLVPRWSDASVQRLLGEVARDPGAIDAHLSLAWALLQRGVEIDAASHLREVLTRDPDNAEAQLVFAELRRRRGRLDEAAAAYEKGFKGGADDFDSRIAYGKLLQQKGDVDGAVSQWLAAKRCWPGCTEQANAPELLLARLFRDAGRTEDAMMELTSFCQRTARAYEPRIELAKFAREAGDRRQEARLLEEAVQIDPFDRQVHEWLADAYVAMDRAGDAVPELEMALAVQPALDRANLGKPPQEVPSADSPEFREEQGMLCVRLAKLLRGLGRDDAARRYLERAIQESGDGDAAAEARDLLPQLK